MDAHSNADQDWSTWTPDHVTSAFYDVQVLPGRLR